jgi:hypothetical protein
MTDLTNCLSYHFVLFLVLRFLSIGMSHLSGGKLGLLPKQHCAHQLDSPAGQKNTLCGTIETSFAHKQHSWD